MKKFKFSNEEVQKKYEEEVAALKKVISKDIDDSSYLWDETVKKYAVTMTKVNEILQSKGVKEQITSNLFKDLDRFLKRCSSTEFHIALVGAVKAGKSTLINALLGYEYASTKVTPETAVLTKFRKSTGKQGYVKVSFYLSSEWDNLWKSAQESRATVFLEEYKNLNAEKEKNNWLGQEPRKDICDSKEDLAKQILKWTSSKSVEHYFVKEVEVGLTEFDLPEGIVFVDTPGLDDVVEYRSNITRRYIDRANAVLVCVKSDALTGQEWGTICRVFTNTRSNPDKVYVIATQTDTLNRPRENWKEQREEWLKFLKGESAYADRELATHNLIEVSAYLYLLLKDINHIKEDDDRYWDLDSILRKFRVRNIEDIKEQNTYDTTLDCTRIDFLRTEIREKFSKDFKRILLLDIKDAYLSCKDSIKESLTEIRKNQEEILRTSQSSLEEIQKKQKEYEQKSREAEKDKKELEALLKQLKHATNQRADELVRAIKNLK